MSKYDDLKPFLAKHMANSMAQSFGFQGKEDSVATVLCQFLKEDMADFYISKAIEDLFEGLDIMSAPWDDPEWFTPKQNSFSAGPTGPPYA